jgi:hypothetical protein
MLYAFSFAETNYTVELLTEHWQMEREKIWIQQIVLMHISDVKFVSRNAKEPKIYSNATCSLYTDDRSTDVSYWRLAAISSHLDML